MHVNVVVEIVNSGVDEKSEWIKQSSKIFHNMMNMNMNICERLHNSTLILNSILPLKTLLFQFNFMVTSSFSNSFTIAAWLTE